MFEDWKQAWRQAVENFQRELDDGSAPRVRAMERELASAAGALARLQEEIRSTRRDAAAEAEAERVCRRREQLARDVQDDETVRIASGFAERHAERADVLQRKIAVLEEERELLARDLAKMRDAIASAPPVADVSAGGHDAHADYDFSRLERDSRERAAAERLEELKRRMRG